MTGNPGEQHDANRRPSGPELRARTTVMALVTLSMAAWVCVLIAKAKPCCLEQCLASAVAPALLVVLSVGMFVVAHELGRGGSGGWGRHRGDDPDDPTPGPSGGVEFDWDGFETEFWAYVERQYTLV